jgi:LytR cell envelope-related transcriptional attenuator
MSNEQPSRPRRSGSNASPMGSTLAIVIAIAAVVVGFLILRQIRSDDGNTAATTIPTVATVDPLTSTTFPQQVLPVETSPTVFSPTTTGATVLVANSSHQNKVAGQLTEALKGLGYTMAAATDGSTKLVATMIQYADGDPAALAVAQSVAVAIGVDPATLETIPTPALLADPSLATGATVIVLLGDDKAGKTLAQMTAPPGETTTTVAGATSTT